METSDRLDFAECLSSPRTQWPAEFNQPPLKYFPRIQKVILKVLAAIFKDQRAINHQVIGAVRDATDCINSPWEQLDQLNLLYKKLEFSQARLQAKLHRDFTLPKNQKKNQEAEENQNFVGTFYTAFENQFRGSEGEVSDRLTEYLTLILDLRLPVRPIPRSSTSAAAEVNGWSSSESGASMEKASIQTQPLSNNVNPRTWMSF